MEWIVTTGKTVAEAVSEALETCPSSRARTRYMNVTPSCKPAASVALVGERFAGAGIAAKSPSSGARSI